MHHNVLPQHLNQLIYEWEHAPAPFDELLVSWNALRPNQGHFAIDVATLGVAWSEWFPYAEWGSDFQRGFDIKHQEVRINQDIVEASNSRAFRIRVRAENGASLALFHALHVCTTQKSAPHTTLSLPKTSLHLQVPPFSQMALNDPRNKRLCSPTSLTALVSFLAPQRPVHPLTIANQVWDSGNDIYGNWVLNVAEGYAQLEGKYFAWVERLADFNAVFQQLHQQTPVVISVKGPLPGSAEPYASGHLLVVKGYDAVKQQVLCMDPAFPTDAETHVSYCLEDLDVAWQRRGRVAYVFQPV